MMRVVLQSQRVSWANRHASPRILACLLQQANSSKFLQHASLAQPLCKKKIVSYCCVRHFAMVRAAPVPTDMRPPLTAIATKSARNHEFNGHELFEPFGTG